MTFASAKDWSVVLALVVSLTVRVSSVSPWRTRMHDYKDHPCIRTCHDNEAPMTCEYDFVIEHYYTLTQACRNCPFNQSECFLPHCVSADGVPRGLLTVNRMLPGPGIHVCLGDTIVVNVINRLEGSEATTIHWHGVLQHGSPHMDGVAMVTQCPIHAHTSFQYRFLAGNPGTHYWHAHAGLQRGDGIFGALVIRQPAKRDVHSALYDYDLADHTVVVHDWMTELAAVRYAGHHHAMTEHHPNSVLINGRGARKPFSSDTPRHHGDHTSHNHHMNVPEAATMSPGHAQKSNIRSQSHGQHGSHMSMHGGNRPTFMDSSNSHMPSAAEALAHRVHTPGHGQFPHAQHGPVNPHAGHGAPAPTMMTHGQSHSMDHGGMSHGGHGMPRRAGFKHGVPPEAQQFPEPTIELLSTVIPTEAATSTSTSTTTTTTTTSTSTTSSTTESVQTEPTNGDKPSQETTPPESFIFGSFNKEAALNSKDTPMPRAFQKGEPRDLLASFESMRTQAPLMETVTGAGESDITADAFAGQHGHENVEHPESYSRAKRSFETDQHNEDKRSIDTDDHSRVKRGSEGSNGDCEKYFKNNGEMYTPHSVFVVAPGYGYRFRFISNGINNCPLQVSIDNHTLLAISTDGSPFRPLEVDSFLIFAGERYDVILRANALPGNYWMRVRGLADCGPEFKSVSEMAILRYIGAPEEIPNACADYRHGVRDGRVLNPYNSAGNGNMEVGVSDLEASNPNDIVLKPIPDRLYYLAMDFNMVENYRFHDPEFYPLSTVDGAIDSSHVHHMTTPQINHISFVNPSAPPLSQYDFIAGTFCDELNVKVNCRRDFCECTHRMKVRIGEVVELVLIDEGKYMENNHPMHLHGHNFRVIGMGKVNDSTTVEEIKAMDRNGLIARNLNRAVVKDTVNIPDGGYTIIRFHANNPGFWLLHCHIAFHAEMGMSMLIQVGDVMEMPPPPRFFPQCGNWHTGIQHPGRTETKFCESTSPAPSTSQPTSIFQEASRRIMQQVEESLPNRRRAADRHGDHHSYKPGKRSSSPLDLMTTKDEREKPDHDGQPTAVPRSMTSNLGVSRSATASKSHFSSFATDTDKSNIPNGPTIPPDQVLPSLESLTGQTAPPQVLELPVASADEHPHYISNFNLPPSAQLPTATDARSESDLRKLMLLWLSGRQKNVHNPNMADNPLGQTTNTNTKPFDMKKLVKPNRVLSMNPLLFGNG